MFFIKQTGLVFDYFSPTSSLPFDLSVFLSFCLRNKVPLSETLSLKRTKGNQVKGTRLEIPRMARVA